MLASLAIKFILASAFGCETDKTKDKTSLIVDKLQPC